MSGHVVFVAPEDSAIDEGMTISEGDYGVVGFDDDDVEPAFIHVEEIEYSTPDATAAIYIEHRSGNVSGVLSEGGDLTLGTVTDHECGEKEDLILRVEHIGYPRHKIDSVRNLALTSVGALLMGAYFALISPVAGIAFTGAMLGLLMIQYARNTVLA